MKNSCFRCCLLHAVIVILCSGDISAQPFTLDKKLKPVKLQLKPHPEWKGASIAGAQGVLDETGDFYYVKGASMYQPIDIYLIGPDENAAQMDLVKNNWNDIQKSVSTSSFSDGIAELKVRTYGDFGIRVFGTNSQVPYQLVVLAAPEVKQALPSPFVAAAHKEIDTASEISNTGTSEKKSGGHQLLPYLLAAVALAIVLLIIVRNRKKKNVLFISLFLCSQLFCSVNVYARGRAESVDWVRLKDIIDAKKLKDLNDKIKKSKDAMTSTKDLLENYFGLGDCLNMPMPPGMPEIPSFCPDDEQLAIQLDAQNCAGCFREGRENFNKVRYNLEQLRIIYKCTKDFSDKAIAFGDNASGVHAVTGLTWQAERAKIEGAVKNLKAAYDKKYLELLEKLQESMIQLAICEEQFGTPDWYDRYGYMYYEFVKEKYKRAGD